MANEYANGAFIEIHPVDSTPGRICRIQYVPNTWTDQIGVNEDEQSRPGSEAPQQQFVHTKAREIKMTLFYYY